jgi:hypothetical protein
MTTMFVEIHLLNDTFLMDKAFYKWNENRQTLVGERAR